MSPVLHRLRVTTRRRATTFRRRLERTKRRVRPVHTKTYRDRGPASLLRRATTSRRRRDRTKRRARSVHTKTSRERFPASLLRKATTFRRRRDPTKRRAPPAPINRARVPGAASPHLRAFTCLWRHVRTSRRARREPIRIKPGSRLAKLARIAARTLMKGPRARRRRTRTAILANRSTIVRAPRPARPPSTASAPVVYPTTISSTERPTSASTVRLRPPAAATERVRPLASASVIPASAGLTAPIASPVATERLVSNVRPAHRRLAAATAFAMTVLRVRAYALVTPGIRVRTATSAMRITSVIRRAPDARRLVRWIPASTSAAGRHARRLPIASVTRASRATATTALRSAVRL